MPVHVDPDFVRLPDDIDALLRSAAERSFFQHPRWYDVFARTALDPGMVARLYADARPATTVLLCCSGARDGELRSLANYYSCEHGPVGTDSGIGAAVAQIRQERPRRRRLRFEGLDPRERAFPTLACALRQAGYAVEALFDSGTWFERTDGLSFDTYLAARPSALRNTWKRKAARLGQRSSFRLFAGTTEINEGIDAYEAIYRESWKRGEPYPDFFRALAHASAALGAARLGVLEVDRKPAAAQLWLVWQRRATIYKLAHREELDDLSVGTLLTMSMMRHVLDQDRPSEVDFGRGDDPYKRDWLPRRRERWSLDAVDPGTPRGLYLAARQRARRILGRARSPEEIHEAALRA